MNSSATSNDYLDVLTMAGFDAVNTVHATRETSQSSTLIDHIFTKFTDIHLIPNSYMCKDLPITDHKLISAQIELPGTQKISSVIKFDYLDEGELTCALRDTDWSTIYNTHCPEKCAQLITEKLEAAHQKATKH